MSARVLRLGDDTGVEHVACWGTLTAPPALEATASEGVPVCSLRIAVGDRDGTTTTYELVATGRLARHGWLTNCLHFPKFRGGRLVGLTDPRNGIGAGARAGY